MDEHSQSILDNKCLLRITNYFIRPDYKWCTTYYTTRWRGRTWIQDDNHFPSFSMSRYDTNI